MAKLVTTTYGEALFELAVEENIVDSIYAEISALKDVFCKNHEFVSLLNHPKVSKDEKIRILENSFKDQISDDLLGFLVIVTDKGRFSDIDAIIDYFIGRVKKHKNIAVAYVTSAIPLDNAQKKNIEEKLLSLTKSAHIEMNYAEDKSLIGGMVIRIGDRIVDNSIQHKLSQMTKQLSNLQLA